MEILDKSLSNRTRLAAPALLCAALLSALYAPVSQATTFPLAKADDQVFGEDNKVVTVYEDTLYDLARKWSLGSEELIRVNPGVDPWIPGAGKEITIPGRHILPPGPHEGVVVNLPSIVFISIRSPRRMAYARSSRTPSASARWIGARPWG